MKIDVYVCMKFLWRPSLRIISVLHLFSGVLPRWDSEELHQKSIYYNHKLNQLPSL